MSEVTTSQSAISSNETALRDALGMMIRAFNVKEVDPLIAFAAIEKAKAVFEHTAPQQEVAQALEEDDEQEHGLGR